MAGVTFVDSYVDEFGDAVYVDEEGRHWQLLEGEYLDDIDDIDDIDEDTLDIDDDVVDEVDIDCGPINRFE